MKNAATISKIRSMINYKIIYPKHYSGFELKYRLNEIEIEIYDSLIDESIFIQLSPILVYFKKLFNICTSAFEFDKTNQTISNNLAHLRGLLIDDTTDHKFIEIFDGISN